MKLFFLTLLMAVVASTSAQGVFDDEGGDGVFSIQVASKFVNNTAVQCTEMELDVITNVLHSIAEIDGIASKITPKVPMMTLAFETFPEGMVLDHTGDLSAPPPFEEAMKHMTTEDKLQDVFYDQIMTEGEDSSPVEEDNEERRIRLLADLVSEEMNKPQNLRGSPEMDPFEEGNDGHRRLPRKIKTRVNGCGNLGQCKIWHGSFACRSFCGFKFTGRRLQEESEAPSAAPSLATSSEPSASSSPSGSPSAVPSGRPTIDLEAEFQERVTIMEDRVSKELTKKLRYLARHSITPCMGIYWELHAVYEANIAYVPPSE